MSTPGLTSEAQLRYILQWFGEFSELQREDFIPILAAAQSGQPELLAATLTQLSCQDKPVSLFQCRIKLFNEWYPTWSEDEKERLVKGVSDIDPEFGAKLQEAIAGDGKLNGQLNGTEEDKSPEVEELADAVEIVNNEGSHSAGEESAVQENIPVQIAAAS